MDKETNQDGAQGAQGAQDGAQGARGEPAPPPAASTVLASPLTEADAAELVELRRQAAEQGRKLKERETRIAELEDENRTLKTPPRRDAEKRSWLDGATLFG